MAEISMTWRRLNAAMGLILKRIGEPHPSTCFLQQIASHILRGRGRMNGFFTPTEADYRSYRAPSRCLLAAFLIWAPLSTLPRLSLSKYPEEYRIPAKMKNNGPSFVVKRRAADHFFVACQAFRYSVSTFLAPSISPMSTISHAECTLRLGMLSVHTGTPPRLSCMEPASVPP
jgi:hypothetical protein